MAKRWNDKDLKALEKKGMKIIEQIKINTDVVMSHLQIPEVKNDKIYPTNLKPVLVKVEKISTEKNSIEFVLMSFKQHGLIPSYCKEHQFDLQRKFRFDYAIPELMLAIEYEGLMSEKSGHTTVEGYTKDCRKYNLATSQGWKILRYTALNYSEVAQDIELFLRNL